MGTLFVPDKKAQYLNKILSLYRVFKIIMARLLQRNKLKAFSKRKYIRKLKREKRERDKEKDWKDNVTVFVLFYLF